MLPDKITKPSKYNSDRYNMSDYDIVYRYYFLQLKCIQYI